MKRPLIFVIVILVVLAVGLASAAIGYGIAFNKAKQQTIASFGDCVAAGYPVMESYPQQCRTKDGKTFVEDIGNELEFNNLILVDSPRPNQQIPNPLPISGRARGTWYFEANFSTELFDSNGLSLGTAVIQADGDWMTEEFVPFSGELAYTTPVTPDGKLVIKNANPSGLPENDKELVMPVRFINPN